MKPTSHKSLKSQIALTLLSIVAVAFLFLLQNLQPTGTDPDPNPNQSQPSLKSQPSPPSQQPLQQPHPPNVELPAPLANRPEQIIKHTGYTVSYNSDWKIPNWVAYQLTREKLDGDAPRSSKFTPDPLVPFEYSATNDDYKNSGWDRGHMAPAADMKWSKQAMIESFYFSNVCPQNRNLNSGMWKVLEEQVRALASQKGILYIVCGPIVSTVPKVPQTIGTNRVTVPDAFFKCLLQNNNGAWHAIAFVFANVSGKKPLSTYATTVDDVEAITGIDFFYTLPDSIQSVIESQVDFSNWNITASK